MRVLIGALAFVAAWPALAQDLPTLSTTRPIITPSGSADVAGPPTLTPFDADQKAMAKAGLEVGRRVMDDQLKDYATARFRTVTAMLKRPGGVVVFCGLINSKNSYGAYTGWKPFVLTGDYFETAKDEDGPSSPVTMCRSGWIFDTHDYTTDVSFQPGN